MNYDVTHSTEFIYSQAVSVSHQVLKLTPRSTEYQTVNSAGIVITPTPQYRLDAVDYFGNLVSHVAMEERHKKLVIETAFSVYVSPTDQKLLEFSPPWEQVAELSLAAPDPAALEASQFCFESPKVRFNKSMAAYARKSFTPGRAILDATKDLTSRIHSDFRYDGNATTVSTPVFQVFEERAGVCQDFAHLQIGCMRALGLPVRYVSGYLRTYAPEGVERLTGADASHAWISVWCPNTGWVDFDPTNDLLTSNEHITLGWGRDYGDISPINGFIIGGGNHQIVVKVAVTPQSQQTVSLI